MIINTYIKDTLPTKGNGIRLAVFQGQGSAGTVDAIGYNIKQMENAVRTAKQYQAHLISFPELYLSVDMQFLQKQPIN